MRGSKNPPKKQYLYILVFTDIVLQKDYLSFKNKLYGSEKYVI